MVRQIPSTNIRKPRPKEAQRLEPASARMTPQPSKPDEQAPKPANNVVAWLGGPRLILDDRRQPREVKWNTGFDEDDERDEVLAMQQEASSASEPSPATPSPLAWIGGITIVVVIPLVALGFFAMIAWRWSGSIANWLGLRGLSGRVGIAVVMVIGVCFSYLIVEKHKAHRSRRRAAVGERSKQDEHAIRWAVGISGVCYCCAYHIAPLPREEDRCVVCPECGAAWRVDDWTNDGGRYEFPHRGSEKPARSGTLSQADWINDARGVAVPVLGHIAGRARARVVTRRAGRRFADAIGRKLAILAGVLIAAWPLAYAFSHGRLIGLLVSLFLVPLLALLALAARGVTLAARARRLGEELVAADRCPCCESQLRPTPSPIDACRLCDTCGSAWEPAEPVANARTVG